MDRTGANFYRCVDMMKTRLGASSANPLPIHEAENYGGLIDLVQIKLSFGKMKQWVLS